MMKRFRNLKIGKQLLSGFLLIILITSFIGIGGVVAVRSIQSLDEDMYNRHLATFDDLTLVLTDYQKARATLRDLLILTDQADIQERIDSLKTLEDEIAKSLENFKQGIRDPRVQENFDILQKEMTIFNTYSQKIVWFIQENYVDEAKMSMYGEGVEIAAKVQDAGNNLLQLKVELGQKTADKNQQAADISTIVLIASVVVAIALSIFLGIYISKGISTPIKIFADFAKMLALGDVNVDKLAPESERRALACQTNEIGTLASSFDKVIESTNEMASVARQLAEGDLTVEVNVRSEDDILGKSLADLVSKLGEVMETIVVTANQVASGSNQVSDSSMALSQGATEQASAIEQLTASLQEISAQVIQNAENAKSANDLTKHTENYAEEGNGQMKYLLAAMDDISQSSGSIKKIIKVIDDIAFQTNILALNAAVEAARAGQHGKGFAVVAEEVRNLAAKSASAAKETTELIEASINKVAAGTTIANNTAAALNQIVEQVKDASSIVSTISVASSEQSSGVEQINQGILQISQVVQSNAASSEESAASSEELSSQAAQLKEIVSVFKLKKKEYSAPADIRSRKSDKALKPQPAVISLGEQNFGKY